MASGASAGSVLVKRSGDESFARVPILAGDAVTDLAERASTKFAWPVGADKVKLFLVRSDRAQSVERGDESEGVGGTLFSGGKLADVEVVDGCYVLARLSGPPRPPGPPAAAPGECLRARLAAYVRARRRRGPEGLGGTCETFRWVSSLALTLSSLPPFAGGGGSNAAAAAGGGGIIAMAGGAVLTEDRLRAVVREEVLAGRVDNELSISTAVAAALAKHVARDRLRGLFIEPTSPSSLRSSEKRAAAEVVLVALKKRVLEYYGLGVNLEHEPWTARTMLCQPGAEPLPFGQCDLAHIWPKERQRDADAICSELKLEEGFCDEPRNYLVLPRDAAVAFDREALILLPSRRGGIKVRRWRTETVLPTTAASLVSAYDGKELQWPTRLIASPCVPFMRLLAWRMLSAFRKRPAPEDGGADIDEAGALDASDTSGVGSVMRGVRRRMSF
jgi:hypothetical protein